MGSIISRRFYSLAGEVEESAWEEARFNVAGQDLQDILTEMQREAFAFVADEGREVTVTLQVEAGPEELVDRSEFSGVQRFIGVPLDNAETRRNKKVTLETASFTGEIIEIGIGVYYCLELMSRSSKMHSSARYLFYWVNHTARTEIC